MNRIENSNNATRSHFRRTAKLTKAVNLARFCPRGGFRF